MHPSKQIVILYHANCPDGFGAAYAAWKKYGDTAHYEAVSYGNPAPHHLENKEVYVLDFSYPKEILLELENKVAKLVVLDHHIGSKEAVESVREHIFDNNRSGAGIAWEYFHPESPLPLLLAHIQDRDIWRHELPHGKEIGAYLGTIPFTFESFEETAQKMEDEKGLQEIIEKGHAYSEYFDFVCTEIADKAEEVEFEGYTVLATSAPGLFRSDVGHQLAVKKGPFAIVWQLKEQHWQCSLRGDGTIDLSEIAKKYGGGGHHDAASFRVPMQQPLPFTFVTH